mmetsp:Transcript_6773/g.12876  ORF Transcript_6773/g.12876 Transcript_6773/m.12876 type:complete len:321 (+) Transcript_6773:722-1684(+)
MDSLEALGNHSLHSLQVRTLGRPVAGRAAPVLRARQDDGGRAVRHVPRRHVKDGANLLARDVHGVRPHLPCRQQLVHQPHVGKRPASHDLVVAAAAAVGVEVFALHPALHQVLGRRRVLRDGAGRGDVVGGDGVPKQRQTVRPGHACALLRGGSRHALEERRVVDVGGGGVPLVLRTLGHLERVPERVLAGDGGVGIAKHLRLHRRLDGRLHLRRARPHVLQEHRPAGTNAQRLGGEVDVHCACQGVGHHQRGGGEVVGARQSVHPPLKVAVPREHRRCHQVRLVNGLETSTSLPPLQPRASPVTQEAHAQRVCRCVGWR